MKTSKDHDLLIQISTDIKYVKKNVEKNMECISWLNTQNQSRKDWQENHDVKEKMVVAIASAIGGFFVFMATKLIDWFMSNKV